MVGGVLFLFRKIYGEVVGALPLNSGAENALLNTTSNRWLGKICNPHPTHWLSRSSPEIK